MASLFDQYGIKEVADVTLYDITTPTTPIPVLFLDTLKVSTIEQTAEQAEARGGKGNASLIIWDFGKEITITLEDALFTPKSLAVMFGNGNVIANSTATIVKSAMYTATATTLPSVASMPYTLPNGSTVIPSAVSFYLPGATVAATALVAGNKYICEYKFNGQTTQTVEISAETFPKTYMLRGDTYVRNKDTGVDEYFQFVVYQAKMSAENAITLQADGDPSTFNFNMRVLRPSNGKMMELIKYNLV
jgi:hypothetical protein